MLSRVRRRPPFSRSYVPEFQRLEDRTVPTVNLLSQFNGMNFGDSTGFVPPDTEGAASPTKYVEVVNQAIRLSHRDGTSPLTDDMDHFFHTTGGLTNPAGAGRNVELSDVMVVWEDQIQKFIVGDQDVDFTNHVSSFFLAVSKSGSPTTLTTADWNFYSIGTTENPTTNPGFTGSFDADYPGNFSYNHDAFVFTLNMFGPNNGNAVDGDTDPDGLPSPIGTGGPVSSTDHVLVVSVNVADLAAGVSQANLHSFRNDLSGFNVRPTVMHDSIAGDPMWLISEHDGSTSIDVARMTNMLSSAAVFTNTTLAVTPYTSVLAESDVGGPRGSPLQPNGTAVTTHIDSRILKAAEANHTIVATHAVTTANGDRDFARWYAIDVSGAVPVIADQGNAPTGTAAGAGVFDFYPAIDISPAGTIGMTFMESSHTGTNQGEFMSVWVTGRLPTDPASTMEAAVLVQAGLKNYSDFVPAFFNGPQRAGDMSNINVDADGSFWAINEFADNEPDGSTGNANWGTAIGHFNLTVPIGNLPVVTNASYVILTEGQLSGSLIVATFTDPDGAQSASTYASDVAWGDGLGDRGMITYDAGTQTFTVRGSHSYAEEGAFTITVTVHKLGAPDATAKTIAAVLDAPLFITSFTPPRSVSWGTPFWGEVARFADYDPYGTTSDYTAKISWGDLSTTPAAVVPLGIDMFGHPQFAVYGYHVYYGYAPYAFSVQVNDVGGAVAFYNSGASVVNVYVPSYLADIGTAYYYDPVTNSYYVSYYYY